MKPFESVTSVFDTPLWQAATQLPPIEVPKVKPKQQSYPGYSTGVQAGTSALRREDLGLANADILAFRTETDTRKLLARLARANPDLSAAFSAYLRVGLTQNFRCWATNLDRTFNRDATLLAQGLVDRWDLVPRYAEEGFSQTASIRSKAESAALEMLLNGAACIELVLDKARLPWKLAAIPVVDLKFYPDDKGVRPVQVVGGEEIDLDVPTVFYTAVDQSLKSAYANSPLESSLQPVLADTEFTNDLRRVIKRAVQPRLQAIIDSEKTEKMMPPEFQSDPQGLEKFKAQLRSSVEQVLNGLSPEDALVAYDLIEFSYVSGGTGDVPDVFQTVQNLINAKLSTGAKTLPSVLGHGSGSQNVASSETLLFMKAADGLTRSKLNEMFSKILTLSARLYGHDVVVHFEYDPIELRPETEVEAFKSMRQSRVLELLSYGFLEDDMASILLTRQVTPPTFKPLSGTRFHAAKSEGIENPYSGTSNGSDSGGGAMNQSLKPKTPTKTKGGQK